MLFPRRHLGVSAADAAFLRDVRAAQIVESSPLAGFSLLFLVLVLAAGYRWADTAVLDEVTRGEGTVVPSSREQVIQSLEGGILVALAVREGDIVEEGQVLLRIDDTRSGASLREGQKKADALRAEIARLRAEAAGGQPQFPDGLDADLREREFKLFQSRRGALNEALGSMQRNLKLAEDELAMTEPMVARGAVSEVDVLRLKRDIIELKGRIQDRRNTFRTEARGQLASREAELAGIIEIVTARADEVKRSVVRSPMRGTVKNIKVTTLGGVIAPGEDIMEIVPLEDRLLVEARIRPSDVAFLRPGQPATVKITAYDYSIYGSLKGRLEQISAYTIADEINPQERYYRVYIRTDKAELEGKEGPLPIIPGMVATAEVLTGQKTVLEYLLKPVLKVRDSALRER
ncbi:MAG: HlyD family type I secretion periplasmic adaptor subunit [Gammaproteobacteria bacterium]